MQVVIARYYKTSSKAQKCAKKMKELWKGRLAWFVIEAKNGYFVINETQARKCFNIDIGYKTRSYGKTKERILSLRKKEIASSM